MKKDNDGMFSYPHNEACHCENPKCDKCGWNPEVSEKRKKEYRTGLGLPHKCYKITFTGTCEVYAYSEEDALKRAANQDMFTVEYDFGEPVCTTEEDDE